MVEIGGRPILWHIMKLYSAFGINDFIICLGYKGYMIKEYFNNYFLHVSDVTIDISRNHLEVHQHGGEPWRVTLIDTGDDTIWEREPLQRLAADGELSSFKHRGFWQPMDTLREKNHLEQLWADGVARWKVW